MVEAGEDVVGADNHGPGHALDHRGVGVLFCGGAEADGDEAGDEGVEDRALEDAGEHVNGYIGVERFWGFGAEGGVCRFEDGGFGVHSGVGACERF